MIKKHGGIFGRNPTFNNVTVDGTSQFANGTAAAPSITNIGDTNTGLYFPAEDTIGFTENGVESMRIDATGNLLVGTTTNTNSSKLVANGTISETVSSTQYLIASQFDVGTAPNELPLVQYLGTAAFASIPSVALIAGGSIQAGTGTICKTSLFNNDGVKQITSIMDLTGLYSPASGDIIGKDASTLPAYIFQIPAGMTVLGGRMTCLETPAGGEDDIDLYSATEGTGAEDTAISTLTETLIINAGAQTAGTVTYFAADPAASSYLYLVSADATAGTYTAGRFLIEIFGV